MEFFSIVALIGLAFMVAMMVMMFRRGGCMPTARRMGCCAGRDSENPKPQA